MPVPDSTPRDPAEAERAAEARIVAWLREQAALHRQLAVDAKTRGDVDFQTRHISISHTCGCNADAIEAGEHRKEPRDG